MIGAIEVFYPFYTATIKNKRNYLKNVIILSVYIPILKVPKICFELVMHIAAAILFLEKTKQKETQTGRYVQAKKIKIKMYVDVLRDKSPPKE